MNCGNDQEAESLITGQLDDIGVAIQSLAEELSGRLKYHAVVKRNIVSPHCVFPAIAPA